jgi:hypothetical protein
VAVAIATLGGVAKMRLALLLSVVLAGLLSGCDSALGPAILNDTDGVIRITAQFSTGPLECSLQPHQSFVQISSGHILESVAIASRDRRMEFGKDRLEAMVKGLAQDDVLVVVRPDSIDVRSLKEARQQGLLKPIQNGP